MKVSVALLISLLSLIGLVKCQVLSSQENFANLAATILQGVLGNESPSNSILTDALFLDTLPALLGGPTSNVNGTLPEYQDLANSDTSNDEIAISTPQHIIKRSGFNYSNHYVTSDDGYVTQLIRLINPLADKTKLKQPPVMLFHGGLIDPTGYIWSSSIQHFPEIYPRIEGDGPITSSNRSLAFMLANNGYDVWLVATRGSTEANYGRTNSSLGGIGDAIINPAANETIGTNQYQVNEPASYYNYSLDSLIDFEFENQVDKVLEVTGAQNVSILGYSLSTVITLAKFGSDPDFVRNKVHNYISLAPVVNGETSTLFSKFIVNDVCLQTTEDGGNAAVNGLILTQDTRNALVSMAKDKYTRYTASKFLYNIVLGNSNKYETFLELPVIGHIFKSTSFKQLKHYCQIAAAGTGLQRYDYGSDLNQQLYNQTTPPKYNISDITVKNWLLISGSVDNLAPTSSVQMVLDTVSPAPYKHVNITGYNHLDLIAGFDNDVQVNIPILNFLDTFFYL